MRIAVYGLWHLGSVTAACLARAGHDVYALDPDEKIIADLRRGLPPIDEPGLPELTASGLASGRLNFTTDAHEALKDAELLWVTFDTPVNERDEADFDFVRSKLESVADQIPRGTMVLISSQVPLGFTRALQGQWHARGLRFAYSPENLRLGKAIDSFCKADRAVVGLDSLEDRPLLQVLLGAFAARIEWMSIESAEMTKHAINAFLASSVTFINELARLCEALGADAKQVERGLKSEGRIGPKAYLGPGMAFSGGTLARDLRYLVSFGDRESIGTPLLSGALESNLSHQHWLHEKLAHALAEVFNPAVAVLGLTYKPGTNTLRRSASVELCRWLHGRGVRVRAHDPAISELPEEPARVITLCSSPRQALDGANVAVVSTEWPEYRDIPGSLFVQSMRRPWVVDPNWFLSQSLASIPEIRYLATGKGEDLSISAQDS